MAAGVQARVRRRVLAAYTSNYFKAGHKLRVTISSSNFPRFDRNLNTGGNNYDEAKGVIAHNAVHHDAEHPSQITITVVPGGGQLAGMSSRSPGAALALPGLRWGTFR